MNQTKFRRQRTRVNYAHVVDFSPASSAIRDRSPHQPVVPKIVYMVSVAHLSEIYRVHISIICIIEVLQ